MRKRNAFPFPPSPRAVRPTRWIYSCTKISHSCEIVYEWEKQMNSGSPRKYARKQRTWTIMVCLYAYVCPQGTNTNLHNIDNGYNQLSYQASRFKTRWAIKNKKYGNTHISFLIFQTLCPSILCHFNSLSSSHSSLWMVFPFTILRVEVWILSLLTYACKPAKLFKQPRERHITKSSPRTW